MKFVKKKRSFKVNKDIICKVGNLILDSNELITLYGKTNKREYDIVKKKWGFYISSSINNRLKKNKFKIAIVKNKQSKYFLCAVEKNKTKEFVKYLKEDKQKNIKWLSEKYLSSL